MNRNAQETRFVVCIRNKGYEVSLQLRKIYVVVPDPDSQRHRLVRIIDESGEDYVYPEDFFLPVKFPKDVEKALALAT